MLLEKEVLAIPSYIVYTNFIPLQSLNPCGEARSWCYMNTLPVPRKRPWSYSRPLLGGGDRMDPQLGALDANIGHVQSDVSEIKIDQRRAGDLSR